MTLGPDYVIIRGRKFPAISEWIGLKQVWFLKVNGNHEVRLKGDGLALYLDFTGAKAGETRKAEFIAYCR